MNKREIKFKFYDKYDRTLVGLGDVFALYSGFARENIDVMQFTGLLDKNGKEVYEGDIVENKQFGWIEVSWSRKQQGWLPIVDEKQTEWEIIGNVWENPELLASSKTE